MPRAPKPPACPRKSLARAKARREAVALRADLRAEAAQRRSARRQAAKLAALARQDAQAALARRYDEAMARPAPAPSPVRERITGRAEATQAARWRAAGIDS